LNSARISFPPSRRAAWIVFGISVLLIVYLTFVERGAHVAASIRSSTQSDLAAQTGEVSAPSAPIQPIATSVINFRELVERDADRSAQLNPNGTPVLRVVHPPREIMEVDSAIAERSASEPPRSNSSEPLGSSPGDRK